MIFDRADDYEALRAKVADASIIPRAAVTLMRHGLAAWLSTAVPSDNPPPSVALAPGQGAPVVIAAIFLRLVRGAVHA
jgi:hypothetical protein